jgi:hypothetical protein
MFRKLLIFSISGVPGLIYDLHKEKFETVTEPESNRIRDIIIAAREQGLSEISVEVSKDFADTVSLEGEIPIEGVNTHVQAKAGTTKNGKVVLSLKLNPDDTYLQIEKLATLHKQGALSESEFTAAKQRLIDKI